MATPNELVDKFPTDDELGLDGLLLDVWVGEVGRRAAPAAADQFDDDDLDEEDLEQQPAPPDVVAALGFDPDELDWD